MHEIIIIVTDRRVKPAHYNT